MKPGVQKISDGLYQAALHDALAWPELAASVDVAVCMAETIGPLAPDVLSLSLPINDNADGCECLDTVRDLARKVASRRVLTICHMGENRSGLLSALILVERGTVPKDAVALVQQNGPHNSPTQQHSFWNPGFVRQVESL